MPCTVTNTCSTRASAVQVSQTADLSATALIPARACGSEQGGGGFPDFTTTTPLPLLKKPTKQELAQPAKLIAAMIAPQRTRFRRPALSNRMDLLRVAGGQLIEESARVARHAYCQKYQHVSSCLRNDR